ncbi:MAG: type II toxin-antitoxin system RelE/ParE family toxin [Xanthomonadales bacterium]|nr:type II toxin-antitoxin system RelE/ParE family toxin [Xanthomonadales bacterium]
MYTVRRLPEFAEWLDSLKDKATKARLIRRLQKAEQGNLGDIEPVGDGVSEMREHFGPGWRMYFVQRGSQLIVLLGGGSKATQSKDIVVAKARASRLEEQ